MTQSSFAPQGTLGKHLQAFWLSQLDVPQGTGWPRNGESLAQRISHAGVGTALRTSRSLWTISALSFV